MRIARCWPAILSNTSNPQQVQSRDGARSDLDRPANRSHWTQHLCSLRVDVFGNLTLIMTWLTRCFFALVVLAVIQVGYYYPQMPLTVASHFDGLGAANAWSGKNGFFGLYLAIVFMLVAVFVMVPAWSEKRANFGFNIPRTDHWLAPERIAKTREFFRRQMMLMGIVHLSLAIYVSQLVIVANLKEQPRLHDSIYWALGLYFLILISWLIHFLLHFRNP